MRWNRTDGIYHFYIILKEALDLLEPLTKDPVDYVRQGAFIALAMILIQKQFIRNKFLFLLKS